MSLAGDTFTKDKLGQLMAAQKAAGLMAPAGRPKEIGSMMDPIIEPVEKPITLAEAGIDKHLAHRAREAARCCPKCCPEQF
jgi:hypothetical protein